MSNVVELNDENFDEVISQGKVLVDFFGTFCAPCKMISPILDDISTEILDVKVLKVDIEKHALLTKRFSVRNIPSLLFFEDGVLKNSGYGTLTKEKIVKLIS